MKCRYIQKVLIAGTEQSSEVRQHQDDCKDCRLFAETLSLTLSSGNAGSPPPELDEKVLAYAADHCGSRAARRSTSRFTFIPMWRIAGAAALLALAMLFWQRTRTSAVQTGVGEDLLVETLSQEEWSEAELEWTVLDVQMETTLAELQGVSASSAGDVADEGGASSVDVPGLRDQLFELELELYFEQQTLERSYRTQEQG